MALTTLDPRTALVVIDLQNGTVAATTTPTADPSAIFVFRDQGSEVSPTGTQKAYAIYVEQGDRIMDRYARGRLERDAQGTQAEWLNAMRALADRIQKQQQLSQQMTQELMNTYMQLLNTPGSYLSGQAEQQQQTLQQTAQQWMEQAQQQQQTFQQQAQEQQQAFQQMAQEVVNTYSELFNIPISYAKEGLSDTRFPIEGYDELSVEEVSARLGSLSAEDLREVRDYEERNKARETILEQLDRRIRSGV